MKKLILIMLLLLCTIVNAQNAIPKIATDIAPLLIGEKMPNHILKSPENKDVSISDLIKEKKAVLVFYRGG